MREAEKRKYELDVPAVTGLVLTPRPPRDKSGAEGEAKAAQTPESAQKEQVVNRLIDFFKGF